MCALVLSGDIISRGYVICNTYFVCLRDFVGLHKYGVTNLDIMLERILSLIPKKPNGDFQHGALKEFAQSVGLKSGNSISDWIAGRSKSYEGYLYQIAAVYNVPVEWLKGETDEQQKSPVQADSPDGDLLQKLNEAAKNASPELIKAAIAMFNSLGK